MIKVLKELAIDSVFLYTIQGLNYIFPLLALPYLISTLGPTSFGIFAYSQAFVQFMILVVDFGFNISATKKIATLPEKSSKIVEIYWLTTMIKLVLALACVAVATIILNVIDQFAEYEVAIYWSMLSVLGSVVFPIWLFQGLNRLKVLGVINAVSKLLVFPLIFILVVDRTDYLKAVILQSSASVIAGLIAMLVIMKDRKFRRIPYRKFNRLRIYKSVKDSWPIFLSNSSISLYTSSLTIILGFFATTAQVGLFGAIERLIRMICFGIYVPINQAAYPKLAKLAVVDFGQAVKLLRMLFIGVLLMMCCVVGGFFLLESFFTSKFFQGYNDVRLILRISILTIIPIALGGLCGQLGLLALGGTEQKRVFSKVYGIVGVSSLVLSYVSIKYFTLDGAILSMMVTEFFIFSCMFYFVRKYNYL